MTAPLLAFVDTETTGLDHHRHEPWEVGLVLYDQVDRRVVAEHLWQLPVVLELADPEALRINRFHERRLPDHELTDRSVFAADFTELVDADGRPTGDPTPIEVSSFTLGEHTPPLDEVDVTVWPPKMPELSVPLTNVSGRLLNVLLSTPGANDDVDRQLILRSRPVTGPVMIAGTWWIAEWGPGNALAEIPGTAASGVKAAHDLDIGSFWRPMSIREERFCRAGLAERGLALADTPIPGAFQVVDGG